MDDTIEKIREHVLWNVNWHLQDLMGKADYWRRARQNEAGLGIVSAWTSVRLAYLRPNVLWWNEIKMAIESDEPSQVLPALERLIRHYRSSNFFLTWVAPLSRSYSEMGVGLIAKGAVSQKISEAAALRDHYQQQVA